MTSKNAVDEMSWEELGFLFEGLSFASRPLGEASARTIDRYSLGPRGSWILQLLSDGLLYPSDIARFFRIGRSLVTIEVTRLEAAGLIATRKSERDGRQMELSLTAEGERARERMRAEMRRVASDRLSAFTRDELLLCARILKTFRTGDSPG